MVFSYLFHLYLMNFRYMIIQFLSFCLLDLMAFSLNSFHWFDLLNSSFFLSSFLASLTYFTLNLKIFLLKKFRYYCHFFLEMVLRDLYLKSFVFFYVLNLNLLIFPYELGNFFGIFIAKHFHFLESYFLLCFCRFSFAYVFVKIQKTKLLKFSSDTQKVRKVQFYRLFLTNLFFAVFIWSTFLKLAIATFFL